MNKFIEHDPTVDWDSILKDLSFLKHDSFLHYEYFIQIFNIKNMVSKFVYKCTSGSVLCNKCEKKKTFYTTI